MYFRFYIHIKFNDNNLRYLFINILYIYYIYSTHANALTKKYT